MGPQRNQDRAPQNAVKTVCLDLGVFGGRFYPKLRNQPVLKLLHCAECFFSLCSVRVRPAAHRLRRTSRPLVSSDTEPQRVAQPT